MNHGVMDQNTVLENVDCVFSINGRKLYQSDTIPRAPRERPIFVRIEANVGKYHLRHSLLKPSTSKNVQNGFEEGEELARDVVEDEADAQ